MFALKVSCLALDNCSGEASLVWSNPFFNSSILPSLTSNPMVGYFFPNSMAKGSPTLMTHNMNDSS